MRDVILLLVEVLEFHGYCVCIENIHPSVAVVVARVRMEEVVIDCFQDGLDLCRSRQAARAQCRSFIRFSVGLAVRLPIPPDYRVCWLVDPFAGHQGGF